MKGIESALGIRGNNEKASWKLAELLTDCLGIMTTKATLQVLSTQVGAYNIEVA